MCREWPIKNVQPVTAKRLVLSVIGKNFYQIQPKGSTSYSKKVILANAKGNISLHQKGSISGSQKVLPVTAKRFYQLQQKDLSVTAKRFYELHQKRSISYSKKISRFGSLDEILGSWSSLRLTRTGSAAGWGK